jgi:predicted nucleic acid-binding protein
VLRLEGEAVGLPVHLAPRPDERAVEEVPRLGIRVQDVTVHMVLTAARLSRQYELLSGDALIVAVMQTAGLMHLASNDADFDRVPGVTRYAPA